MEIRVLRYFLAVVREESITRAAEALNITQPTLSRQLAQLEDRMDRGLIDVGLLLEPIDMDKYDFIRLSAGDERCVFMRPDDPLAVLPAISPKDLRGHPVMLPRRLNVQSELARWFGRGFDKLQVAFMGNLATNKAVMVANGLGYALAVKGSATLWDENKIVARPLSPALTATTMLAWKRGQPFSRAAEKFIAHLQKSMMVEAGE